VLREVERWLAEARVAAVQMQMHAGETASGLSSYRARQQPGETAAAVLDNGDDGDGDGEEEEELEPREAWALDRLCDALLVKGALVPISRKSVINASPLSYPLPPLPATW
jgi:ribosomal biogenesis protein LAS1